MQRYYAVNKETNVLKYITENLNDIKFIIKQDGAEEDDFFILKDVDMKYISRIVYVDGNCIYNNKDYWYKQSSDILEDYDEHEVLDFMGKPVDKLRYEQEMNNNISRLTLIDGVAGEVAYNIAIGKEFIALFREECIFTDFKTVTPLEIAQKLMTVISLVETGSFREAKLLLKTIETDAFLTEERLKKYEDMLDSADAITYATDEDFFYKADEEE